MALIRTGNDLGGTQQNLSTSYKTLVTAIAAAASPRRIGVCQILIGTTGAPASAAAEFDMSRMTADDGTKTNVTPLPLNPADTTFSSLSRANFTAEGTITATSSVFYMPLNTLASFNWIALSDDAMLIGPATASNGFALRAKATATYTSTAGTSLYFKEF